MEKLERKTMFLIPLISLLCFSPVFVSAINDTLTPSSPLSFNQTLISAGGQFELGFFTRGTNSTRYYLGIWYKDIPSNDIIWVANRNSPSPNTSCSLHVTNNGNLIIRSLSSLLWSSNQSSATNPVLQLLDSGNLVVREADDNNPDNFYWESFNNPTDTLIPGQMMEYNNRLDFGRPFTSWRAPDDPGSGNFSFAAGPSGRVHLFLTGETTQVIYMSPVVQQWKTDPLVDGVDVRYFNYTYTYSADEVNYVLQQPPSVKLRITVTFDGLVQEWMWDMKPNTTRWNILWSTGSCDCGPNAVCSSIGQVCGCPHGFSPADPAGSQTGNWIRGCVRNNMLACRSDGFWSVENVKVLKEIPSADFVNASMSIDECANMCKTNCNCNAYGSSQVIGIGDGNSGCIAWMGNFPAVRNFTQGGQTLFVRLAASDLENGKKGSHSRIIVAIVVPIFIATMLVVIGIWIYMYKGRKRANYSIFTVEMNEMKSVDSLQFDLSTVRAATRNFSLDNKLGEGGFGEVYKGVFEDGQEIAVKRLSQSSTQGALEFKTEILLVAKLQHKNLVKLLGFCLASKEKILVYEYLQNSSLDRFLFDSKKKLSLDWNSRFRIVVGIARGLMYLHVDSRLKVIHRDLKTSNILLDENMNPKISDFGLAKLFGIDQTQDNTKRIVGTYGYMAPEYAMTGHFSVKSDVYSFGIIVLEIVSGQRSKFTISQEVTEALLHRAWRLWNEGKHMDLVDTTLGNDYPIEEVTKCIHIGLLCIQENPIDRPTMEIVVATLSGEAITLPVPKAPHFFGTASSVAEISYSGSDIVTLTEMEPR